MSIYQNYLALRRVFKTREVELTAPAVVKETLRGLIRRFIRRYGIDALRPHRVEPVTPPLIERSIALATQGTTRICGVLWCMASDWTAFIVTAWMVINLSVGSRKGESTELPGDVDENDWLNRAALSHQIGGRTYVDPPPEVLRSRKEGDRSMIAPRGSKCDQWGTCHGTEPIILPFHDNPLNASKWLMDIELRWPAHGEERTTLPLFPDAQGQPFKDYRFTALIKGVLTAVVGETRAKMLSPHSWRVWIATSLRMCGASDARIQAMGRWLNPDSVKIYARMTKEEYALWIDKIMSVRRIDSTRTTNLPIMDAADAIATVHSGGKAKNEENQLTQWSQSPPTAQISPSPLKRGQRLSVYWTEMNEWYDGTFQCSQVEAADDGGRQRSSCVVYDAAGDEASLTRRKLTYWHCLDDEQWRPLE